MSVDKNKKIDINTFIFECGRYHEEFIKMIKLINDCVEANNRIMKVGSGSITGTPRSSYSNKAKHDLRQRDVILAKEAKALMIFKCIKVVDDCLDAIHNPRYRNFAIRHYIGGEAPIKIAREMNITGGSLNSTGKKQITEILNKVEVVDFKDIKTETFESLDRYISNLRNGNEYLVVPSSYHDKRLFFRDCAREFNYTIKREAELTYYLNHLTTERIANDEVEITKLLELKYLKAENNYVKTVIIKVKEKYGEKAMNLVRDFYIKKVSVKELGKSLGKKDRTVMELLSKYLSDCM